MMTKRSLRLALLGLLAFMVFCLIVLEITLNDPKMTGIYGRPSSALSKLFFWENTTSSITLSNSTHRGSRNSKNSTTSVSRAVSTQRRRPPATDRQPATDEHKAATAADTAADTSAAVPYDHCQQTQQGHTPTQTFSMKKQLLSNGSRPDNCSSCFNSDFPPLIENCGVCNTRSAGGGAVVELLMVILTTHGAVEKRQAIRETWASVSRNNTAHVRHVFLLGRSQSTAHVERVRAEQDRYGDVIMYDFVDSYKNLTLKTLTAMHWAVRFCGNARFVLKADDDMWINVPSLLTTARKHNATLHTAIGGACHMKARPIRNSHSKWYASPLAYPRQTYPGFCSGTSYVTSLNTARHVTVTSPDVPFFYLEDVYMALCIQRLGPPFRLFPLPGFFHGGGPACALRKAGTVTVHEVRPARLREIWNARCP